MGNSSIHSGLFANGFYKIVHLVKISLGDFDIVIYGNYSDSHTQELFCIFHSRPKIPPQTVKSGYQQNIISLFLCLLNEFLKAGAVCGCSVFKNFAFTNRDKPVRGDILIDPKFLCPYAAVISAISVLATIFPNPILHSTPHLSQCRFGNNPKGDKWSREYTMQPPADATPEQSLR